MFKRIMALLFKPHDGTRRAMLDEVVASRQEMETATDRLEYVVKRMLQENDRIARRERRNADRPHS